MSRNGNGAADSPIAFKPSAHVAPRRRRGFRSHATNGGSSCSSRTTAHGIRPWCQSRCFRFRRQTSGSRSALPTESNSPASKIRATLDPDVRQLLDEELARREFVPVIERIVRVSGTSEPCEWTVQTDRGPTRFVLKSEDDVRRIGDGQILIVDAHGTRYQIPDIKSVDAKSRRIVEWYV